MSEWTDWLGIAIGGAGLGGSIVSSIIASKARARALAASEQAEKARAHAEKAVADAASALVQANDAQAKTQMASLELNLREQLSKRREHIHAIARDLEGIRAGRQPEQLSSEDKVQIAEAKMRFISAHEEYLNALESACGAYRDKKIDRDRFRKTFDSEIREIAENNENHPFYALLHPSDTKYRAFWAVYKEWNDLENRTGI